MSETGNGSGAQVKDRRRFNPDGSPRETEPTDGGAGVPQEEERAQPETLPAQEEVQVPSAAPGSARVEEAAPSIAEDQLRADLDSARNRVDELARALLALERDKDDFKKRLLRERERMIDVEKGNVAQTLLEAVDELDLCLESADDSPLARGVRLIRDHMLTRLASLGVERISLEGTPFDPNLAEAVDLEVTAKPEDDQKVVREVRAAYRLKDRIVRHGRVKVARYVQPAEA